MKKLMIALAVACVAVATQAATFAWGTEGKAYSIADATIEAGLSAGHYDSGSANKDSMYNQISSYAAAWAYEITFTSDAGSDVVSGSLASGNFTSRMISVSDLSSALVTQTDPVTTVNYSIVITGTLTDGQDKAWQLTSDAIVGSWDVPSLGDLNFSTSGPTGWTVAPEPTSGLLLLVGLAGLALKRKRA